MRFVFGYVLYLKLIKTADKRWLRESFSLIDSDFPLEIQIQG